MLLLFIKIISIPDEEYFSEQHLGALIRILSKLYDVPLVLYPLHLIWGSVLICLWSCYYNLNVTFKNMSTRETYRQTSDIVILMFIVSGSV